MIKGLGLLPRIDSRRYVLHIVSRISLEMLRAFMILFILIGLSLPLGVQVQLGIESDGPVQLSRFRFTVLEASEFIGAVDHLVLGL